MLSLSSHNIISRAADSNAYFIVNLLSGNADILDRETGEDVLRGVVRDEAQFIEKGYLVDPTEETKRFRKRYADFVDERDNDETQIFFVPWYSCNFACGYCYQEGYENPHTVPSKELIDTFFSYIQREFSTRRKYVTLFGGEPLLPGDVYMALVKSFLDQAKSAGLETAIVTNGYSLADYVDILKYYPIREVQVTLDGLGTMHNSRRPLKGGGETFDLIVNGIDRALEAGLTINLRVVIDRENIHDLPNLAKFAVERGWTKHPGFKTQLGRNYELHVCQTDRSKLLTRIEMYQELYTLIQQHPEIMEFHKPAFSVSKFLFERGELPSPLYDSCPGTKTEWAFDFTGRIYSCTATVGKQEESLGTFFPKITKRDDLIEQWEERDVTSISECKECNLRLACGGGCASVAFNRTGRINSPDCRPIKELMELGISTYFKEELQ